MSWRYQLPVSSPVPFSTLVRAGSHALGTSDEPRAALARQLGVDLRATNVVLTQSGTAALVLAIRQVVAEGGIVAMPAYGCADLVSAALRARVRVRLYDVDPSSLSPDLASLEQALARQVNAVVVAHLFGVPADVDAVQRLATAFGVAVIEDAAQGLGSSLRGRPGGALADRSVLSFGRGKGVSGGAGGALLLRGTASINAGSPGLPASGRGFRPWIMTAAQSAIGQPAIYRIPASLPFLHLGEMVYKDAPEPAAMPTVCAVLAQESWNSLPTRVARQRTIAADYASAVHASGAVHPCVGAEPSWLRYPVRVSERIAVPTELGVLRGYPATLDEQRHAAPALCANEPDMPGAKTLRRELVTLPTHQLMTADDIGRVRRWLETL